MSDLAIDPLADADARAAAIDAVLARWRATPRSPRPAALQTPTGDLDDAALAALAATRDERPIDLKE
jgi:hypothetical protein